MKGKNKKLQLVRLMTLALEPWKKADRSFNTVFNTSLPHCHNFEFTYAHYFHYNSYLAIYDYSLYLPLSSSTGDKIYSIYPLHLCSFSFALLIKQNNSKSPNYQKL